MKIYIADVEDTLRKISEKIIFPLVQLLSLNSGIGDPDLNLAGRQAGRSIFLSFLSMIESKPGYLCALTLRSFLKEY